jgi:hypothetical protein
MQDGTGLSGIITLELFDENGSLKERREVPNLITDAGDLYYAQKAITDINPASPAAPTEASGMKLGTGATSPTKADAGLGTYITGSNNPFDATYPQTNNLGAGNGVQARYVTTWGAGDVTNSAITEIVICTDAAVDEDPTAAETISRATFSAINKTASDVLVATWNHLFFDAP